MASEWFYAREGKKNGPFSSMQLRAMAQSGQLLRTDLIWKNGMAEWRPAGASSQLFEGTQQSQVVVPAPPQTPTPVSAINGLKQTAQTAARAAQFTAEKTRLSAVTLPAAYLQLGQHCFMARAFASEFPADFTTLARVAASLAAADVAPVASRPSTFSERAQALESPRSKKQRLIKRMRLGVLVRQRLRNTAAQQGRQRSSPLSRLLWIELP